jgi:phospholipid transport system transporter-binding protein
VDSSAVSLLLEWRRTAQAAARRVEFVSIPPNLQSLADLYGVADLLGTPR